MAKTLRGQDLENTIKRDWINQNLTDYNVDALEYPDGLRTKPDLQNYVAFYINTRDKSKGGNNDKNPERAEYYLSPAKQKEINTAYSQSSSRLAQEQIQQGGQNVLDNAGLLAAGATAAVLIGTGGKIKDWKSTAAKAGAAGVTALAVSEIAQKLNLAPFKNGTTSRLTDVVTLHISEKPVVHYGVNYTNKDIGAIAGMLIQGSAKTKLENITDPEMQSRFLAELTKIPQLKSGGGVISDLLELSSRTKTNPFREVLFESVNYRSFQFNYRFLPKTSSETDKVRDIIHTFKKHMHPELAHNKLFYIYPSEFDIKYFYKDKENNYLHKFARCALTDVVVDYGGDQFVTFPDGAPVEIGMSLKFQELEQMTSEGINRYGY
jgi:hypothetical protein